MLEKILNYLKRTGLYFIAQPISHWVGLFISGLCGLIAAFIFEEDYVHPLSTYFEQFFLCTLPFVALWLFLYFTVCKVEGFSRKDMMVSLLPLFVIQHIYIFAFGPSFWINGITPTLSFLLFPEHQTVWVYALVQLGLQLIVYLPIYLFASHRGYLRKLKLEAE